MQHDMVDAPFAKDAAPICAAGFTAISGRGSFFRCRKGAGNRLAHAKELYCRLTALNCWPESTADRVLRAGSNGSDIDRPI